MSVLVRNDLLREMIESGVIKYGKEFEEAWKLVVGTLLRLTKKSLLSLRQH